MARMFNIDPRQQAQRQYEVLVAKYYVERIETLGSSIESVCHGATGGFIPRLKQVIERPGEKWRQHLAGHLRGLLGAIGARLVKEANSSSVTLKNWPETLGDEGKNACIQIDGHLARLGGDSEPSFDLLMKILAYFAVIMEEVEVAELQLHHSGRGRRPEAQRSQHPEAQRSQHPEVQRGGPKNKGPRPDGKKGPKDPNKPRRPVEMCKTELCRKLVDGKCPYGEKCKYSHSEEERAKARLEFGPRRAAPPVAASAPAAAAPEPAPSAGLNLPGLPNLPPASLPTLPGLPTANLLPQNVPASSVTLPSQHGLPTLPGLPYNGPPYQSQSLPGLPLGPVQPLTIPMAQPLPLQLPQASQ